MRIAALVVAWVVAWLPSVARANDDEMVSWCATAAYQETEEFSAARDLSAEVEGSDVPDDEKYALSAVWGNLLSDNDRAATDYADLIQRCNEALGRADGVRARIDAFNASCGGDEPPDECAAEAVALSSEVADRHAELVTLTQDIDAFGGRLADLESAVQSYLGDGRRTLTMYFTGTRAYHVTAKSWIDGAAISELSFRSMKLLLEQDDEPVSPNTTGDYRLFQTFVVEVTFKQGKIKRARFLRESLETDAGRTKVPTIGAAAGLRVILLRVKGKIRVTDQKVSISDDRRSVVFTRRVEGHPSLVVLALDKLVPFGQLGALPTIWNSLRLEVTADGVTCDGYGSSFPSHRYWLGDDACGVGSAGQVQPSEYFGVEE